MILIALLACRNEPIPDTPDTTPEDSGDTDTEPAPADCSTGPTLPVDYQTLEDFSGSEDFAFDGEGYLVSVDYYGNLTREDQSNNSEVILPDISNFAAGTRMLPDGSVVIADAETGSLVRVTMEGGYEVILSGLAYPNGVEVGLDGMVYVAEQNSGQIRQVDPTTGEYTVIATNLYHPNGLTFGPGHETLYVGSFGGGTVHALHRADEEGTFEDPELLGSVPSVNTDYPAPCESRAEGDTCLFTTGGVGVCADDEGSLECVESLDFAACDGLAAGDSCDTTLLDESIKGRCTETERTESGDTALFCPRTSAERVESCEGSNTWDSCGAGGYCEASWEGVLVCIKNSDYNELAGTCDDKDRDKEKGDTCVAMWPTGPWEGTCTSYPQWGYDSLCEPYTGFGSEGGLDGINTDECGNVYVTEYITGIIWSFPEDGGEAEIAAELPSSWIPNMRWGNGIGGWEEDVLYVMDRDQGRVFGLEMGLRGREVAFEP